MRRAPLSSRRGLRPNTSHIGGTQAACRSPFARSTCGRMEPFVGSIAHTLLYDGAIVGDNQRGKPLKADRWACVSVPALVMDGEKSPKWMHRGNRSLASALPNARCQTLQGQTHMLKPKAHAPVLVEFFN